MVARTNRRNSYHRQTLTTPMRQCLRTSGPDEGNYDFPPTPLDQIMTHVKDVLKKRTFAEEIKAVTLAALLAPLGSIEKQEEISPLKSRRVEEGWVTKNHNRFPLVVRSWN